MTLSSVITLRHLENISIIGYNNVTVLCTYGAQLAVFECNNLIIAGIAWIGCGKYDPVIHGLSVIK